MGTFCCSNAPSFMDTLHQASHFRTLQRRVETMSKQLARAHGALDAACVGEQVPTSPGAVLQAMSTRAQIQRDR